MTDVTERNRQPVTPNDDQTPRTTPTSIPHPLDDQLPPSLFAPPGEGSPPPLFGSAADRAPTSEAGPPPRLDAGLPPPPSDRAGGDSRSPAGELPPPSEGGGVPPSGDRLPPPLFRPIGDKLPPPETDRTPPTPPRTSAEPPSASLHLGPPPDRPAPDRHRDGAAPDRPASDRPASDRPASDRPASDRPASDRLAPDRPAPDRPAPDRPTLDRHPDRPTPTPTPAPTPAAPGRPAPAHPVPLDGNLYLKPVRRLRTEPSAEWTPHPSYGAEPEGGKRPARTGPVGRGTQGAPARGPVDDPGPDTELDLVLDLASGGRTASATFSVPVPVPVPEPTAPTAAATTPAPATEKPAYPGRRHSVIANETTASIPVHLLFRDDQEPAEPGTAAGLPAALVRRPATGDRSPATRRPPVPRSPTRVEPSTRPAPPADPRLAERPGPALPGSAALLVGAAGIAGGLAVLWWRGVLPAAWQTAVGLAPRADLGIGFGAWALLALLATVVLLALGGLGRGKVGYAWVLTLFGDYRGSVRRTGLVWVSPLLLRRRVDVRLRHWRSEPLPAVDANGTALRVVVLVVWRIKDTVRAVLGIEDHEAYLSAQVEAAMARVLSQLPADAFHEDAPSLRDAEAVGDALTRMLKADCEPVGVEVYSAQPTGIEYAPEVAAAMQRRRIAAIDSRHRDSVLTSVVDAVDDTVNRLTTRGIVELDDYERKALVKDLTVAFYTGRSGGGDGA
ncbi:SPFH domain-containing protein [Streptomyces sp. NPDC098077]|uniref:SPFH domain-containing protein n=1 Tax=Streptomyces sp. NPDC098077 TaxID=3366093 RepID=UPI0037F33E33